MLRFVFRTPRFLGYDMIFTKLRQVIATKITKTFWTSPVIISPLSGGNSNSSTLA